MKHTYTSDAGVLEVDQEQCSPYASWRLRPARRAHPPPSPTSSLGRSAFTSPRTRAQTLAGIASQAEADELARVALVHGGDAA